jgi:hypothetical protein
VVTPQERQRLREIAEEDQRLAAYNDAAEEERAKQLYEGIQRIVNKKLGLPEDDGIENE